MADGIDFTRATISGVSEAKAHGVTSALKDKAAKAADYNKIKESVAPNKEKEKMSKQLKDAYIKDTMAAMTGSNALGSSGTSTTTTTATRTTNTAQETEQERIMLMSKIKQYYELPRFADRTQLKITAATPIETLKAEIYDLENGSVGGGELFFAGCTMAAKAIENLSHTRFNALDLQLDGYSTHVSMNREVFQGPIEILAIKYKHLFTVGPWGALANAFIQVGMITHRYNTDPEFRKTYEERMTQAEQPIDPKLEEKLKERMSAIRGEPPK